MAPAKRFLVPAGFLLAPACFLIWLYATTPYFPAQFDDGGYWVATMRLARAGFHFEALRELLFVRTFRPIAFPLVGLIPYLLTGSISRSMLLLMPALLAVFSFVVFLLFRREGRRRFAVSAALALSTLPAVLYLGTIYLGELPYLCLCALALLPMRGRSGSSAALMAVAIGGSLCIRPAEGAFVWGMALLYVVVAKPALRGRACGCALVALAVAACWYAPGFRGLSYWVKTAFFFHGPVLDSRMAGWEDFFGRAGQALELAVGAFTWPGLAVVVLGFVHFARRERRVSFEQAWVLALAFLPVLISVFMSFRMSASEPRHVIATTLFAIGYYLTRLSGRPLLVYALLAGNLLAAPGIVASYRSRQIYDQQAHAACAAALGAAALNGAGDSKALIVGDGSLPLLGDACTIAGLEQGAALEFDTSWDPEFVFFSFLKTFSTVVVVAPEGGSLLDSIRTVDSARVAQLRELLSGGHYREAGVGRFAFEGKRYREVTYQIAGR